MIIIYFTRRPKQHMDKLYDNKELESGKNKILSAADNMALALRASKGSRLLITESNYGNLPKVDILFC